MPIPDLDRGRCEHPNLKAVVLEKHPHGHLWKLGCSSGVLDQWYSRNQFQPTLEKFMSKDDVPMEQEISLRSAARQESISGGQGYFRCNCTGNCQTKRCKCFKAELKCNSRCHNQRSYPIPILSLLIEYVRGPSVCKAKPVLQVYKSDFNWVTAQTII